jgi:predicted acetyltransferase
MDIELVRASRADATTLENLFQLYTHDFSEFWAGTSAGDLQPDGRFARYELLDLYWREPARRAFLIRTGGALAGFALLNDHTHSGLSADHNMAEFFVARKYRREGLGLQAAQSLFTDNPGVWELAVVRANTGALAFWRRTVSTCPGAGKITEQDVRNERWNGPIIRFTSSGRR